LGSIVFYNSYLPEIAFPDQHDRVSARIYVWLCRFFNFISFNLTMVMMPEWYGISDGSLPARISFLSVGWMALHKLHFIIYQ
jgi:UMF1 family MFS transporter